MKSFLDDDLILYLFGDADDPAAIEAALAESPELRGRLAQLRSTLELVDQDPVPARDAGYGAEVWQRVEQDLRAEIATRGRFGQPHRGSALWMWLGAAAAAAMVLLGVGFGLGRLDWLGQPRIEEIVLSEPGAVAAAPAGSALSQRGRDRLLTAAVSDHLSRSGRLLTEVSNASLDGQPDPLLEQQWAIELLAANRLYRRAAEQAGQGRIARLLAELEPVFLELAHPPGQGSGEWNDLQQRIEDRGLLFKVRVTEGSLGRTRVEVGDV